MKLTINLSALALLAIIFVSCDNSITTPVISNTEAYEWSVYNNSPGLPFVINKNSYFVMEGAGVFYKITNGIRTRYYTSDSLLNIYRVSVYDESYMVFEGYKGTSPGIIYAIYDNGVYTYVNSPETKTEFLQAFIKERGVFYLSPKNFNSERGYKYANGTFNQYTMQPGSHAKFMGKTNGNIYLWMESDNYTTYSIYKITDAGTSLIRTENTGNVYFNLSNDVIKIDDSRSYYYFTETGWSLLFDQPGSGSLDFPLQVYGKNKNQFAVLLLDSLLLLKASAWDGIALTKQTNFPSIVTNSTIGNYDKYLDNTFLLGYYSENLFKVLKGTYKGN